ncbi:MAG: squalene synthase HpnC [Planctomycetota bacterium]
MVTMELRETPSIALDRGRFMALAASHYENFPVGSVLVPKHLRRHVHRLYAFARTADDIADEEQDAALLTAYRQCFLEHLDGKEKQSVPLFADLVDSIRELNLPVPLFTALLDAFALDLKKGRYNETELFDYCRQSADPVGRLVLLIFGLPDERMAEMSDRICTALQLVNHLQDMASDYRERNRIYFPQEDFEKFSVSEKDLEAASASPQLRSLVLHWSGRCAEMLASGWPLTDAVPGRLRMELRAVVRGAAAILAGIKAVDGDVLANQVRLSKWQKTSTLFWAMLSKRMPGSLR